MEPSSPLASTTNRSKASLPEKPVYDITSSIRGRHERPSSYGGQSDVYAAFWASPNGHIPVAIKVLRFNGDLDQRIHKRLHNEISLWGRVSHPNVQPLLGVCLGLSSLPAMVSEWQTNGDIMAFLKTKSHDPKLKEIKMRLLVEVLEGVTYLHEHDIVHGDIKSANVLISGNGSALLSDFGFSIVLTEHSRSLSQQSAPRGTTRWMAPELFNDDERVAKHTKASDVWALGCLIIELETGGLPYSTKRTEQKVLLALSEGELPVAQPLEPEIVWQLVLECCQVQPSDRLATAHVLSHARMQWLNLQLTVNADIRSLDDFPPIYKLALSDFIDHLHECGVSQSPISEHACLLMGTLASGRALRLFHALQKSIIDLLATCVAVALQDDAAAAEFLSITVPALLPVLLQYPDCFTSLYRYPADIVRPLGQILAACGHSGAASSLMRVCSTPGVVFRFTPPPQTDLSVQKALRACHLPVWSGDGMLVATYTSPWRIDVHSTQTGDATVTSLPVHALKITAMCMSLDGRHLAYGGYKVHTCTVMLWDIQSRHSLDIGSAPPGLCDPAQIVISRDGSDLATVDRTAKVHIWRVGDDPWHLSAYRGYCGERPSIQFTTSSQLAVANVSHNSMFVSIYDLTKRARVQILKIDLTMYTSAFLIRGQQFIGIRHDHDRAHLHSYDVVSNDKIRAVYTSLTGDRIVSVASSLDGAYIAAGTGRGLVYIWNAKDGTLLDNSPLPVHRHGVSHMTFSEDGARIISATEEGEFSISDIRGSWLRWGA